MIFFDHVRRFFGNHNGRRIGVPANQIRHDRSIDNAQPRQAVNAEAVIHDGHIIMTHFACSNGMIDRFGALSDIGAQCLIILAIPAVLTVILRGDMLRPSSLVISSMLLSTFL